MELESRSKYEVSKAKYKQKRTPKKWEAEHKLVREQAKWQR